MSVIESNRSISLAGIGNVLVSFVTLVTSWNDLRKTRQELSRLTDRELEDIGLCRSDIEWVARGHRR